MLLEQTRNLAIQFHKKSLESCETAVGTVVVVDVLRAFTTTAFAFERGATEIFLVSTVKEAFELREQKTDLLLMGEVNGYPIDRFDLPNSPSVIEGLDLTGHRLALRTTAGTQGVIRSSLASNLYVASLCVATATAESIRRLGPDSITFVDTGVGSKGGGEEDVACSDYITSIISDSPLSTSIVQNQVKNSKAALKFSEPCNADFSNSDLELALEIDRFSFAMSVSREEHQLILRKANEES